MAAKVCVYSAARAAASAGGRVARPSSFRVSAVAPRLPVTARQFTVSAASWKKLYTKDHEWIELDSDGTTGTVGVSEYAAKALGDVVYVEMSDVDIEVAAGDVIGSVESVKAASDILSPAAGTIIEVNPLVGEKAGTVNKSPEGEGWLCKIKVTDTAQLDELMDEKAYAEHTAE